MSNAAEILRHELIGLECEVLKAANKSSVGIKGNVLDETLKTIVIDGKRIFKKGSVFRFNVSGKRIDVDGDHILARPEDRIKKKIKTW